MMQRGGQRVSAHILIFFSPKREQKKNKTRLFQCQVQFLFYFCAVSCEERYTEPAFVQHFINETNQYI